MKKILILALLVLGQLVFADSVSNWCGYNGELVQKLNDDAYFQKHVGYDKKGAPVIAVSTFDSKTLQEIKKVYEVYNYSFEKIVADTIAFAESKGGINRGLWYNFFNKFTILKLSNVNLKFLISGQLTDPFVLKDKSMLLPEGGLYPIWNKNDEIEMILFLNPKIILANYLVIQEGGMSEEEVIKQSYTKKRTNFNPCE